MDLGEILQTWIGVVWLFIAGACAGSFAMAIADRGGLPKGRSKCDGCGRDLNAVDLLPIVGWIIRQGKCLECRAKISARYPLFEAATGGLVVALGLHLANIAEGWSLVLLLILVIGLTIVGAAMSIVDWRTMILPPRMNMAFLGLSLAHAFVAGIYEVFDFWTAVIGGIIAYFIAWIVHVVGSGKWLGGGDVKLAPSMGLLLGAGGFLLAVAAASYLALGYVVTRWIAARGQLNLRKMQLPFGPFLLAATAVVYALQNSFIEFIDQALRL